MFLYNLLSNVHSLFYFILFVFLLIYLAFILFYLYLFWCMCVACWPVRMGSCEQV